MIEKARQDRETNIRVDGRREAYVESQGEPRGERDVIRLRNPTEDKKAFRVLTYSISATPK